MFCFLGGAKGKNAWQNDLAFLGGDFCYGIDLRIDLKSDCRAFLLTFDQQNSAEQQIVGS